jgi:hypothetical protein
MMYCLFWCNATGIANFQGYSFYFHLFMRLKYYGLDFSRPCDIGIVIFFLTAPSCVCYILFTQYICFEPPPLPCQASVRRQTNILTNTPPLHFLK